MQYISAAKKMFNYSYWNLSISCKNQGA